VTPKRYIMCAAIIISINACLSVSADPAPMATFSSKPASDNANRHTQVAINLVTNFVTNLDTAVPSPSKPEAIKTVTSAMARSKATQAIATQALASAKPVKSKSIKSDAIKPDVIKPESIKPSVITSEPIKPKLELAKQPTPELITAKLAAKAITALNKKLNTVLNKELDGDQQVAAKASTSQATQSKELVQINQPRFATPPKQPKYPRIARKRGLEGTVTIEVLFDQVGKQLELILVASSGASILDNAALEAVSEWQFSAPHPQTAKAYKVKIPVTFALN
jgi:protein TonB